jgi:peptide/nickel transport system permease protein
MMIAKRLMLGLVTMFMVSVLIFCAVNLLPGDFAQAILGQGATPEAVEAIRRDLGLDQPIVQRYFSWFLGAIQGDFGTVVPMYANYIDAHSTKLAHADDVGNLWMLDNSRICKRWWMA